MKEHAYPVFPDLGNIVEELKDTARMQAEYGSDIGRIQTCVDEAARGLRSAIREIGALPADPAVSVLEPGEIAAIRALRPEKSRMPGKAVPRDAYRRKLKGALLGRLAGNALGAPVEGWRTEKMKEWADYSQVAFPPRDYWQIVSNPAYKRHCRDHMQGAPADDDIVYTILGLLIMEEYGPEFTVGDVGAAWLKYLPTACSAEFMTLSNLKAGVPAEYAGEKDNPYRQWIGADIRSDPWGYMAPGRPEQAAEWAWRDAVLSHRRNGVYGEMFFSAAIAAAFSSGSVREALEAGLHEIPAQCMLARDLRWALDTAGSVRDYGTARRAVDDRFGVMSPVHTNNNACLTVFGLLIGGDDFGRVIGETVAMGYDNDCTAATAGSLFGAVYGINAIPEQWTRPLGGRVNTYLNGLPVFQIADLLRRFERQAVGLEPDPKL